MENKEKFIEKLRNLVDSMIVHVEELEKRLILCSDIELPAIANQCLDLEGRKNAIAAIR